MGYPLLRKVKKSLKEGKCDKKDDELKPFRRSADELTYQSPEDILLKNTRIVIPTKLPDKATQPGHVGHQGIEKMKS